jgi:hypothetical protein
VIKKGLRLGLKKKKKKKRKKKPVCQQQQPGWFNCETMQILDAQNLSQILPMQSTFVFCSKLANYPEGSGGGGWVSQQVSCRPE